jgi:hypothetical protein
LAVFIAGLLFLTNVLVHSFAPSDSAAPRTALIATDVWHDLTVGSAVRVVSEFHHQSVSIGVAPTMLGLLALTFLAALANRQRGRLGTPISTLSPVRGPPDRGLRTVADPSPVLAT